MLPSIWLRNCVCALCLSSFWLGSHSGLAGEEILTGKDTLDVTPVAGDLGAMLAGLRWTPGEFPITVESATKPDEPSVIRFPSPVPTGDEVNDRVALIWRKPINVDDDQLRPAIVVVHESGSAMPVGTLFAQSLAAQGVHTFMIHLPNYGLRRREGTRPSGESFLLTMRQAIADVRRARDVAATMQGVDPQRVALQGTSLGGFVSATVAGLDQAYDAIYIMLAGGDLVSLLANGEKEAAQLRERLSKAGYSGDKLTEMLQFIEPTRLGSRMAGERIWLYSADQDRVVPLANTLALKSAAGIPDERHLRLPGTHTSTILFFPVIVKHVVEHLPPPGVTTR